MKVSFVFFVYRSHFKFRSSDLILILHKNNLSQFKVHILKMISSIYEEKSFQTCLVLCEKGDFEDFIINYYSVRHLDLILHYGGDFRIHLNNTCN